VKYIIAELCICCTVRICKSNLYYSLKVVTMLYCILFKCHSCITFITNTRNSEFLPCLLVLMDVLAAPLSLKSLGQPCTRYCKLCLYIPEIMHIIGRYRISRPIRRTFFPKKLPKFDLRLMRRG